MLITNICIVNGWVSLDLNHDLWSLQIVFISSVIDNDIFMTDTDLDHIKNSEYGLKVVTCQF